MPAISPKAINRLIRRPHEFARFQATGQLPQGVRPQSPLIDALLKIPPADRVRIMGLRVDASLGYQGSRLFHNAEQALRWIRPDAEVFGSFPAESWRIKNFRGPLSLADLLRASASHPPRLAELADLRSIQPSLANPGDPEHTDPSAPPVDTSAAERP